MTDASTRRLVIVRHGETLDNAAGVWQGLRDCELSPVGLAQADKAAPVLAAFDPQLLITSDLVRARVTAERAAEAAGLPVRTDQRLREIDVGRWQGVTTDEVRRCDPELLAEMGRGADVRRGHTGETVAELAMRVRAALDDVIALLDPGRVALVVCHGVAARAGVASLVGLDQMRAQQMLWVSTTATGRCSLRRGWCPVRRWHRGGGSTPGTSAPDPRLPAAHHRFVLRAAPNVDRSPHEPIASAPDLGAASAVG